MSRLIAQALLRALSIFLSIVILKFAIDGIGANEGFWGKAPYLALILIGIPTVLVLINYFANKINKPNRNTGKSDA